MWDVLRNEDGSVDMLLTCPQDVKPTELKHATETFWRQWATQHEVDEMKEGIWFEIVEALIGGTHKRMWTADRAGHVRSWVWFMEVGHRQHALQLLPEGRYIEAQTGSLSWRERKEIKC